MGFIYRQQNLIINREIRSSLQGIYGIGWHKSIFICARLGVSYPFIFSNSNFYNMQLLSYILDFFYFVRS
jgi:ribosomal protein S13